jgi:hypothetical protein
VIRKMGLTNKKEEQLRKMPTVQNRIRTSKNGKYVIQETIITHIKPREYYEKVLENAVVTEDPLEKDEFLVSEAKQLANAS